MASLVPQRVISLALAAGMLAGFGGCSRGPRAPALSDEPVYQNDAEGLRFLAPQGWSQQAKGTLPPGPLGKERMLVQYRRLTESLVAGLEVTACDAELASDPATLLAGPSFGIEQWPAQSPREPLAVGDVAAERFVFAVPQDQDRLIKEVVVFPRGNRVYFFTGLYYASDVAAREQLRASVESILWRK